MAQHVVQQSQGAVPLAAVHEVLDLLPLEIPQLGCQLDIGGLFLVVGRAETDIHLEDDAKSRCQGEHQKRR